MKNFHITFFLQRTSGSKISYAEPQNLTERVREALLDRRPVFDNCVEKQEKSKISESEKPDKSTKEDSSTSQAASIKRLSN